MSMSVREAANDYAASAVKDALYEQRMSERELARRMDVSQSWLNKRLTGEIPLRFGEVFEITEILQISLERFIDIARKARETAGRVGSRINYFSFPSRLFRNLPAWGFSLRTA